MSLRRFESFRDQGDHCACVRASTTRDEFVWKKQGDRKFEIQQDIQALIRDANVRTDLMPDLEYVEHIMWLRLIVTLYAGGAVVLICLQDHAPLQKLLAAQNIHSAQGGHFTRDIIVVRPCI